MLRKLWWFNHCQWSYASRAWPARQKGPSAVVRPAAKGLILWSKNCRLPHMFPINVECSVGLEEAFIMKWPSLHQTPPCCLPACLAGRLSRGRASLSWSPGPGLQLRLRRSLSHTSCWPASLITQRYCLQGAMPPCSSPPSLQLAADYISLRTFQLPSISFHDPLPTRAHWESAGD